jgi:hypothetical protein
MNWGMGLGLGTMGRELMASWSGLKEREYAVELTKGFFDTDKYSKQACARPAMKAPTRYNEHDEEQPIHHSYISRQSPPT